MVTDVSVLLIVKDGEDYLAEAISSVLDQDYTGGLELVILDDCSKDKTPEIIKGFTDKDLRVVSLRNTVNLGLTKSLNLAIKSAKGRYCARIDHDDIWFKDKLSKQMVALESNPNLKLVGSGFNEIDEEGRVIEQKNAKSFAGMDLRKSMRFFNPFVHSSVVFDKEAVASLGGYNETFRYAQDYELWCKVAKNFDVDILPDVLCLRRRTSSSISYKKERKQRYYCVRIKLTWMWYHGASLASLIHLIKDIAVVLGGKKVFGSRSG